MPFPRNATQAKGKGKSSPSTDCCTLCNAEVDTENEQYISGTCSHCGTRAFHFDCVSNYVEKLVRTLNSSSKAVEKGKNIARNRPQDLFAQNRTVQRKPQRCPTHDCAGMMANAELIKPSKPAAAEAPPAPAPAPARQQPAAARPQQQQPAAAAIAARPQKQEAAKQQEQQQQSDAGPVTPAPSRAAGRTSASSSASAAASASTTKPSISGSASGNALAAVALPRPAAASAARPPVPTSAAPAAKPGPSLGSGPASVGNRRHVFGSCSRLRFPPGQRPKELQMCLIWEEGRECRDDNCPRCHGAAELAAREDEWEATGAVNRSRGGEASEGWQQVSLNRSKAPTTPSPSIPSSARSRQLSAPPAERQARALPAWGSGGQAAAAASQPAASEAVAAGVQQPPDWGGSSRDWPTPATAAVAGSTGPGTGGSFLDTDFPQLGSSEAAAAAPGRQASGQVLPGAWAGELRAACGAGQQAGPEGVNDSGGGSAAASFVGGLNLEMQPPSQQQQQQDPAGYRQNEGILDPELLAFEAAIQRSLADAAAASAAGGFPDFGSEAAEAAEAGADQHSLEALLAASAGYDWSQVEGAEADTSWPGGTAGAGAGAAGAAAVEAAGAGASASMPLAAVAASGQVASWGAQLDAAPLASTGLLPPTPRAAPGSTSWEVSLPPVLAHQQQPGQQALWQAEAAPSDSAWVGSGAGVPGMQQPPGRQPAAAAPAAMIVQPYPEMAPAQALQLQSAAQVLPPVQSTAGPGFDDGYAAGLAAALRQQQQELQRQWQAGGAQWQQQQQPHEAVDPLQSCWHHEQPQSQQTWQQQQRQTAAWEQQQLYWQAKQQQQQQQAPPPPPQQDADGSEVAELLSMLGIPA